MSSSSLSLQEVKRKVSFSSVLSKCFNRTFRKTPPVTDTVKLTVINNVNVIRRLSKNLIPQCLRIALVLNVQFFKWSSAGWDKVPRRIKF